MKNAAYGAASAWASLTVVYLLRGNWIGAMITVALVAVTIYATGRKWA